MHRLRRHWSFGRRRCATSRLGSPLSPLFTQVRVAASAGLFLDGLLGDQRRKTGWMRAEAAGDPGPWRQQALLGRGRWDADALRDMVRDYALETLADQDAVLVVDETGFLKQGKASCGVGRQYTGSAGKITNCQIGVFAAYVSRHGQAFIDRALYLPKAWTGDADRMAAAHVPTQTAFATKPALALAMIERALAAGVPFSWVAADRVYGVGDIEMALRCAAPARAMCLGSTPITNFTPGSASQKSPARPRRSQAHSIPGFGSACRREKGQRAKDFTAGPIANSLTSTRANTTKAARAFGRAGF